MHLNKIRTATILGGLFIISLSLSMLIHQHGFQQSILQATFELLISFLMTFLLRYRYADKYKENTFSRYWIIVYGILTLYSAIFPWYFIDALKNSFS